MLSFRTETENNVVEKDIIELERKIRLYKEGKISEEKFRTLRLARGVYGQRQKGVQMIRIKIPFGKTNSKQLLAIAQISDNYSNGKLHFTTRQDIQIHHVSLDDTPRLWEELEKSDITLREACGNTVRNITASENAGVNPHEPFDVSPYAYSLFKYFLRKPFANELGRKFKIAFSSDEKDTALTYIHDLGFIPKIIDNKKGFKVLIGGGLGAQPFHAQVAKDFLPVNEVIAFTEKIIRVFDELGERSNRHKARLKYLINKTGVDTLLEKAESLKCVGNYSPENYLHNFNALPATLIKPDEHLNNFIIPRQLQNTFEVWQKTNVFKQKQTGYYGVYIRFPLGNTDSEKIRELAEIIKKYSSDDVRITVDQNLFIRYVPYTHLKVLFLALHTTGLSLPGAKSTHNITACPGTDTCNLGISNSTRVSLEIEKFLQTTYKNLLYENELQIKISGCMNSCGQHGIATIGLHGSSIKTDKGVLPALQLLIGGKNNGNGNGTFADKIIKFPSKRVLQVLNALLQDYEKNKQVNEKFYEYYARKGKDYYYQLVKSFADVSVINENEYIDWGQEEKYKPAIGVGECAGVIIDLVQTLFAEAKEKIELAEECLLTSQFADAVYYVYAAIINAAKAVLTKLSISVSSHYTTVENFEQHVSQNGIGIKEFTEKIKNNIPSEFFANQYLQEGKKILQAIESTFINTTQKIAAHENEQ